MIIIHEFHLQFKKSPAEIYKSRSIQLKLNYVALYSEDQDTPDSSMKADDGSRDHREIYAVLSSFLLQNWRRQCWWWWWWWWWCWWWCWWCSSSSCWKTTGWLPTLVRLQVADFSMDNWITNASQVRFQLTDISRSFRVSVKFSLLFLIFFCG